MNRFLTIIKRFFRYLVNFGPRLTFFYIVYPRFGGRKAILRRHDEIKRYIKRNFSSVLNKYTDAVYTDEITVADNRNIWVCWLQGADNMPDIVRACYKSIIANADGREVVLITVDNVEQYISIPDFIKDKVANGVMSRTHFADYIRIALLKNFGGLWIDATVFVTDKINIDCKLPFFSVKQRPDSIHFVSQYRWAVWLLGCSAEMGKIVFGCLENLFVAYLKKYNCFIDFFLFDYFLAVMYDEIPLFKQLVDDCPYNNPDAYKLASMLNEEYYNDAFMRLKANNTFHKLSWKQQFQSVTSDGKDTFYSFIKNH
ncbi:MAG: capsular polysaccharide synthesis protein [Candidatus Aphodosoma sp.]